MKRYSLTEYDSAELPNRYMAEDTCGDYVSYEDAAKLESENAALRWEVEALKGTIAILSGDPNCEHSYQDVPMCVHCGHTL